MLLTTFLEKDTPGRIRTCDPRFRKPMLYPLSYGGDVRIKDTAPINSFTALLIIQTTRFD